MNDSLLMLSLPNSGSTWLAETIANNSRWSRYWPEYFNPIRNELHAALLEQRFGCELVSCYRNIAVGDVDGIDADIAYVWGAANLNFTKEVFSPFKLPAFKRHFRCFVLLRNSADTFPPGRLRVWSFYEHAWFALGALGLVRERGASTMRERALEAHRVMSLHMTDAALEHGVPIVNYRDLFGPPQRIAETLGAAIGECSDELLAAIAATRRLTAR